MSHLLRALPDLLRVAFAGVVAYRAEMVIWILSTLLPLVMLALWNAVASDGPVAGFGQVDFARYFATTLLVRQITSIWLMWELSFEIRNGTLSNKLLKPMHPLVQFAVDMLAALPFRVLVLFPVLLGLLWWRPELWRAPSPLALLVFAGSIALAWIINFCVQALFGVLSFWVDKSDSIFQLWFALWALCSGYIVPIALFPEGLRPVLRWLPFHGTLGLPVEILAGFVDPVAALPEVGVQLGWAVALGVSVVLAWRAGVRRYGAFGA